MSRSRFPSRSRLAPISHALRQATTLVIMELEPRRLMTSVTAATIDSFIESIGVNTHFGFNNSSDHSNAYLESVNPNLPTTLGDTGIRYIRDYFGTATDQTPEHDPFNDRADDLYDRFGIKVEVSTGTGSNVKSLTDIESQLDKDWVEGVEGFNEPDGSLWTPPGDTVAPRTFDGTRARTQLLADTVNGNPDWADIPVLSSAMGNADYSGFLRGSGFDIANIHMYFASNPGSYRVRSKYLEDARNMMDDPSNPDKKIIVTEQGYSTSTWFANAPGPIVSLEAQRDYIPRLFMENFGAGISRTYLYNLIDNYSSMSATPQGYDNGLGILYHDGTDKPAMTALRNMLKILDEGSWDESMHTWSKPADPTPNALDYTLGGDTTNIHQQLLERSNGDFYLALWQEIDNDNQGVYIDTPAKNIKVNINGGVSLAQYFTLDSDQPQTTFVDTGAISIPVDSQVVFLKIVPSSSTDPTSVAFTKNFNSDTLNATPAGWNPGTGDTWQVKANGSDRYVQNTNATGTHLLAIPIGATASSVSLDFDMSWQSGGTSPNGDYNLTSGIDLLNSSNNGYRILLHQGNSGSSANDNSLTQIFKVINGSVSGSAIASGTGFNHNGSGTTPVWSHVRVVRDSGSGQIKVYEDPDNNGTFNVMARATDTSYNSFSKTRLVVGNVTASAGARFDNVTAATPTIWATVTDATAAEHGADSGFIILHRTGDLSQALTVTYYLGGTASPGTDLPLAATNTATFDPGDSTVTIAISPTNDGIVEGDESVTLRMLDAAGYHIGAQRTASVRIKDDAPDLVVTNVTWTPSSPGANASVVFKITIENMGTIATVAGTDDIVAEVRFNAFGGPSVTTHTTQSLAPGASITLTTPSYQLTSTDRVVRVGVDDTFNDSNGEVGAIPELRGDNNTFYSFMTVGKLMTSEDFNSQALSVPPTGFSVGPGAWRVLADANGDHFLDNGQTNTGTGTITKLLDHPVTTSSGSFILDYDYTWRWGGTSLGNGSASLGSFVDILDDNNNGYRIRFRQGNGDNTANDSQLTQIFTVSNGIAASTASVTGKGFNLPGWKSLGEDLPNWRSVRIVYDHGGENGTLHNEISVMADLLGDGTYTELAVLSNPSEPATFTKIVFGADNLINTVDPEWDDISFRTLT